MREESIKSVLDRAEAGGYAVPAVNVSNMETALAALEAASLAKASIIVQVAPLQVERQHISYSLILSLIRLAAKEYDEGIFAVHLDHGDEKSCEEALRAGFPSVMFDGSKLPLAENTEKTRNIATLAYTSGAFVEAELGIVGGNEGESTALDSDEAVCTNPAEAAAFLEETGVDTLAIAIGNAHGFYKKEPRLRFHLLEKLNTQVAVPLVLHGASGLSEESLKAAIAGGIRKINFFTELDHVYTSTLQKALQTPGIFMMDANEQARVAFRDEVSKLLALCGSEGKA